MDFVSADSAGYPHGTFAANRFEGRSLFPGQLKRNPWLSASGRHRRLPGLVIQPEVTRSEVACPGQLHGSAQDLNRDRSRSGRKMFLL